MPTSGLREKPKRTQRVVASALSVFWAVLIFCLSSIPGSGFPPHPDILNKIAHFFLYLVLAILVTLALHNSKRALWKTALIAIVICSLYGASDEFHQSFTGRNCDIFDWIIDTVSAFVGAGGTIWFISSQKVKSSRAKDADKKAQKK